MAHFTVYVTRMIWEEVRRHLEQVGTVVMWDESRPVPRQELLRRITEADALLCMADDVIDREVIQAGKRLRVICTMSADVDNIDLEAATERNITVCHTPGTADESVADMTMALLLACARNLIDADLFIKQREWKYWAPDLFLGVDVQGSTIGIIGLGHVGLEVAHRALGFGMRVLYYSHHRNEDAEQRLGLQYGSLDDLLREADFVTVHVPLRPSTYGLLNEPRLRLMKKTAYLINMSRGPVVDRNALVRALSEGWIAGAGLDVFDQEPISPDDPLLGFRNVILTPHIGANTCNGMVTMMRMAGEQIIDVLQGRTPAHAINRREEAA